MGGGFTVAMGMSKAFEVSGETSKKVFGVVGDSTFFHCGMTGAAEIIYNKGNMIPVVLDNSITGMTGHQDNPGTGYTLQGDIAEAIRIEDVLKSMGFQNVIIVDPQDLKAMQRQWTTPWLLRFPPPSSPGGPACSSSASTTTPVFAWWTRTSASAARSA